LQKITATVIIILQLINYGLRQKQV